MVPKISPPPSLKKNKAQSTSEYILVVFLAGLGAITALNILQLALSTSFLSLVAKFAVEIK